MIDCMWCDDLPNCLLIDMTTSFSIADYRSVRYVVDEMVLEHIPNPTDLILLINVPTLPSGILDHVCPRYRHCKIRYAIIVARPKTIEPLLDYWKHIAGEFPHQVSITASLPDAHHLLRERRHVPTQPNI